MSPLETWLSMKKTNGFNELAQPKISAFTTLLIFVQIKLFPSFKDITIPGSVKPIGCSEFQSWAESLLDKVR